ncbi:MAG: hypothetical protein FJ147_25655 [Deltaproteobacteria bacterium]|nr:hypothetical protein [Deltaproteobacteria bacterium]
MKSTITHVTAAIFKKTAYVLGMFSLLATMNGGDAQADRSVGNSTLILSHGTWTHTASACTPDESSIDYQMGGASVSFPGSITGEITLRCNITNIMDPNFPSWNTLEVVYRDPDGSGAANRVRVTLHKVGLNGTAENLTPSNSGGQLTLPIDPSLLATFDSNTAASTTSSTQVHTVGVNHNFDFATNAYYVKITLKRDAGSTTNPAAFVVRLNGNVFLGG